MALFQYKTVDEQGKKRHFYIEAQNPSIAKEKLRSQGVVFLSFKPVKKTTFSLPFLNGKAAHFSRPQLMLFTLQLSQLLEAGIPLYESLISIEEQLKGQKGHPIVLSLLESVKGGRSLSEAMADYPKSFSELYRSLVAAGESVGALGPALKKLFSLLESQEKWRKKLAAALLYPFVLGSFSCLIVVSLLVFVIPPMEALFEGKAMGTLTTAVIGLSHLLTDHSVLLLTALGLGIAGSIAWVRHPKTKYFLKKQLLQTPLLKTTVIKTALARFARTFATLLEGGVPLIEALKKGALVMNNPVLAQVIVEAEEKIVEGSCLSHELSKCHHIPPLFVRLLAVGEESGQLAKMAHKTADLFEGDVEKSLTKLTELMQPVILIFMGAVVGLIMMAILLPLTDVSAFL